MRFKIVVVVLGIATLAGCSPVSGTPSPTTTTSTGPSAPKVTNPIDTTKYQADPCGLLTAAQVAPYTVTTPGSVVDGTSALGPGCSWGNTNTGTTFIVQFITANKVGLTALYINKDIILKGGGYFEPTTVQGYPAVFNSQADQRKDGTCSLAIGIADSLDYNVAVAMADFSPKYNDPCGMATQIADMAMTTLRGGS